MGKKRIRRVAQLFCGMCAVMAAGLMLTACGRAEGAAGADGEETCEKLADVALEADQVSGFRSVQIAGEQIYCGVYAYDEEQGASVEKIYTFSLEGDPLGRVDLPLGEARDMVRWCAGGDGSLYLSAVRQQEEASVDAGEEPSARLYKFDASGALLYCREIPELKGRTEDSPAFDDMAADAQGRVYLLFNQAVFSFDEEGGYRGSVAVEQDVPRNLVQGESGDVYLLCQTQEGGWTLSKVDFEGGRTVLVYSSMPLSGGDTLAVLEGASYLYPASRGLYRYDRAVGKETFLFSWSEQDLQEKSVRCIGRAGDGRLLVVSTENGGSGSTRLLIFGDKNASESSASAHTDDRTVLTMAALNASFSEEDLIWDFNHTNEEYRVELVEYCEKDNASTEELEDAQNRMLMEVALGGKGYDLICLDSHTAAQLVQKGCFEDLYPYLDASGQFSRDDFFHGVLSAYTVNGRLVALPPQISVQFLVGSKADFEEGEGWTLRELLDYWADHPGSRLMRYEDREVFAQQLLSYSDDNLVSVEDGQIVFDEEGCRLLLELLKVQDTPLKAENPMVSVESGETLMTIGVVGDLVGITIAWWCFGDIPHAFVSYPDAEGDPRAVFRTLSEQIAIDTRSDCKEGAWEFLEFVLSREAKEDLPSGISSLRERFDERAENFLYYQYERDEAGEIRLDENGEPLRRNSASVGEKDADGNVIYSYEGGPLTEEGVEEIRRLMDAEGVAEILQPESPLCQVVMEEGESYWNGQKPLDEVVDIIGNRLTLYLQEQGEPSGGAAGE